MSRSYTIEQLATLVGGTLRGSGAAMIRGVADISGAASDQATWVSRDKFAEHVASSRAGVVLVSLNFGDAPMPVILCDHIDRSVAKLLGAFATPRSQPPPGVHPSAIIDSSAKLGEGVRIGPNVVIESGASIGARTVLHSGVYIGGGSTLGEECELFPGVTVLDGCTIGSRVVIHPNSVIGGDGFGYYFDQGRHNKVPHIGGVIIEDDVEIGACSCVDRSKFGHTVVGAGTKIDNQVQVAHNVKVGRHCVLAGQTAIGGSGQVGDYGVLGGRVAVVDGCAIGEQTRVAAIAVVDKDVPAGVTVSGFPAQEHRKELRERAAVRRLPKLLEEIKALARRVEQLEASTHHRP